MVWQPPGEPLLQQWQHWIWFRPAVDVRGRREWMEIVVFWLVFLLAVTVLELVV